NEDFAIESLPGDIFQLGNTSWRVLRIESGKVRVEDAKGMPPNMPFWFGEAPGRSDELSTSVARLRADLGTKLGEGAGTAETRAHAARWLATIDGVSESAATQLVEYLAAARAALTALPDDRHLVLERFFDESGGMQLVIHSSFGSRINRAFGLALRKRFCRKFNFELQAAATEDAIVLSLGETHSFALEAVTRYLDKASVRDVLVQALLDAPMFTVRWRWNANIALAVPRVQGGRKVPPQLQRMQAEDLVAVVFPDQIACAENLSGRREIPDHPLVVQTIDDCLHDAMDIDGLERLLGRLESGEVEVVCRDLTEPSPLSQEILNARPYAFLDDAPLEERRTRAVASRRWLDPESAADLGRLDGDAIRRVCEEAWPRAANVDELHDMLVILGVVGDDELRSAVPGASALEDWVSELVSAGRATRLETANGRHLWVAAERLLEVRAVHPTASPEPVIEPPPEHLKRPMEPEIALKDLLRSRLEGSGPVTAERMAQSLDVPVAAVTAALGALEAEGFAFRGRFTPDAAREEWCERRLLARIHRYTLGRLRREIEPVTLSDFMRFLFDWQHIAEDTRMIGPESVSAVVDQLQGFEAPAAAWEAEILAARVSDYDSSWLDALCLSGRFTWLRLSPGNAGRNGNRGAPPVRSTPITLLRRSDLPGWLALAEIAEQRLTGAAARVLQCLDRQGACFFDDLAAATGLLRSQLEDALGELCAAGLVNADSFAGLRAMLLPAHKRGGGRGRRRGGRNPLSEAGRWSRVPGRAPGQPESASPDGTGSEAMETLAWSLLNRYGVVMKP
ncbi:MAG TPA: ATP-dependent DNA helicase, partial [Gammaproteobacteria bacterium]|nr:ATP-dependent DNA helicase [Gammaproteobacteria bacterium]